ncbi:hypothetical protein VIGAN_07200500 [Vigna angularis var. angularis]|uniref:NPH3 domain-containing protein n=1 Tax=Vigna angularis var. angularis TaxID=157739 RepID=A0A0S3SJX3_PHAAN|nr:hypothetical protein VIGAN_07200500 [Vigna angularis var. angularis]
MRCRELKVEMSRIESKVERCFLGLKDETNHPELKFKFSGKKKESSGHSKEQKTIIETLISIIPPQPDAVSCKFMLQLLKMAMMYSVSPALATELEKRVSMLLEDAEEKM